MCGIVGIVSQNPVNESIYAALTLLQHRGQDAAGIVTIDDENRFRLRKANGLVSDVFRQEHMLRLQGHAGLGHVRYPTAGSSSVSEAQPFYVNSPYGLSLVHNGNLTNSTELKDKLFKEIRRFFYISLTAGCTLNQIKQTSFKLIESIVNGNSIDEIKEDLNRTIISRRMYAKVYDALDNDVYNEKFLKPLMLSLE